MILNLLYASIFRNSFKISLSSWSIPKGKSCERWLQELFTLDGKIINNIKKHQKEAKQCRLSTGVVKYDRTSIGIYYIIENACEVLAMTFSAFF